jgi:hypothetical protein
MHASNGEPAAHDLWSEIAFLALVQLRLSGRSRWEPVVGLAAARLVDIELARWDNEHFVAFVILVCLKGIEKACCGTALSIRRIANTWFPWFQMVGIRRICSLFPIAV